jgi:alpha-amylase/alpha-mannosidase (GH57 family)
VEKYICIHGHFYQPPRENPWLETTLIQDSAYPFHDWNERITAECYAPNATARLLDGDNRIVKIVNNYTNISFDFGPTLLTWLEKHQPEVYAAVLAADRESRDLFSGHGSAIAQAYSHMILPLANNRDKFTQVHWGILDFQHRFGRMPEGMWLPETAVDLETLDILAERGIRFTILAPHQAKQARRLEGRTRVWRDLQGARVDPTMPYAVRLPSGRTMTVFFYDGPIARATAFEGLLNNGERFATRLLEAYVPSRPWAQLVHIATDGETYGHHHHFGEMGLAYALDFLASQQLARITNYGEYLEKHPPTYEVEILENTSWSCCHGVERWRSDCGCGGEGSAQSGQGNPANQSWRAPLRAAFDWLRDALAPRFEEFGRRFLKDPWAARNDYVSVLLSRSHESVDRFLSRNAIGPLDPAGKTLCLKLLELQRHAMLMYTSCGWFFEELSRIETQQVSQHAARAIQLAEEVFGETFEGPFLDLLEKARSNRAEMGDGRRIYEKMIKPALVDAETIAAHFGIYSLFEEQSPSARLHGFQVDQKDRQLVSVGKARLMVGQAQVTSSITLESGLLGFAFLHLGDHNLFGGVRQSLEKEEYASLVGEAVKDFDDGDFPSVICCLEKHFGVLRYSLKSLVADAQQQVLNHIYRAPLAEAEAVYRQLFDNHVPLVRFLTDIGVPLTRLSVPLPKALHTAAEFLLNLDLRRAVDKDPFPDEAIRALLSDVEAWQVTLDAAGLSYALKKRMERHAAFCCSHSADLAALHVLERQVDLARAVPFQVDFCKTQNYYHTMLQTVFPVYQTRAHQGDERALAWVGHFAALGEKLGFRVDAARSTS